MNIMVDQKTFIRKNLFSLSLVDAVALPAFPSVAFVPLKANYVTKVNYWFHLAVRLQGKAPLFNPCAIVLP